MGSERSGDGEREREREREKDESVPSIDDHDHPLVIERVRASIIHNRPDSSPIRPRLHHLVLLPLLDEHVALRAGDDRE